MTKADFFVKAIPAVLASGHVWPMYAVCEAALESAWGGSKLAIEANNLFGQKQGFVTAGFETVEIETHEVLDYADKVKITTWPYGPPSLRTDRSGLWDCKVPATWPKLPDWEWSFRERMTLLSRMECYGEALLAPTGEQFVRLVSLHWATDPKRADNVIATHDCNRELLCETLAAVQGKQAQA